MHIEAYKKYVCVCHMYVQLYLQANTQTIRYQDIPTGPLEATKLATKAPG